MVTLGLWVTGRKNIEIKSCVHHIMSRVPVSTYLMTAHVGLVTWPRCHWPCFSTVCSLVRVPLAVFLHCLLTWPRCHWPCFSTVCSLAWVPLAVFLHCLVSCTILFETKSPWAAHSQGVGTLHFLNTKACEVVLEEQVWVMACYWIRSGKGTKRKTKKLKAANLKTCIFSLFQKKILLTVTMRSKKIIYLNFVICEIKINFNLGLFFLLILIMANSSYLFHCTLICTTGMPKLLLQPEMERLNWSVFPY